MRLWLEQEAEEIIFSRPEDQYFHQNCSWFYVFPVESRPVGQDGLQQCRLVMQVGCSQLTRNGSWLQHATPRKKDRGSSEQNCTGSDSRALLNALNQWLGGLFLSLHSIHDLGCSFCCTQLVTWGAPLTALINHPSVTELRGTGGNSVIGFGRLRVVFCKVLVELKIA